MAAPVETLKIKNQNKNTKTQGSRVSDEENRKQEKRSVKKDSNDENNKRSPGSPTKTSLRKPKKIPHKRRWRRMKGWILWQSLIYRKRG